MNCRNVKAKKLFNKMIMDHIIINYINNKV